VAGVERRVPDGSGEAEVRVDFRWSEERAQAEACATDPHPGCFVQRVRKAMKRKGLEFCAVKKSG
jgi:hypothetical protein